MAIAIHSLKTSNTAGAAITISCDLSTTAYRFCVVCSQGTWSGTPTGVTCGGDAMTEQIRWDEGGFASAIHVLKAHKTGTQDVVVTFASSCNNVIEVYSLRNVDQTTPVRESLRAYASTGNPSRAVTSAVGDLIIDSLAWNGDSAAIAMAADSPQVDRYQYRYPAAYCAGGSSTKDGAASTTTMSWTRTGLNDIWCQMAMSVAPSAAEDNGRMRLHIV